MYLDTVTNKSGENDILRREKASDYSGAFASLDDGFVDNPSLHLGVFTANSWAAPLRGSKTRRREIIG